MVCDVWLLGFIASPLGIMQAYSGGYICQLNHLRTVKSVIFVTLGRSTHL